MDNDVSTWFQRQCRESSSTSTDSWCARLSTSKKQKLTSLIKDKSHNWANNSKIWSVEDWEGVSNQLTLFSNI